MDMTKCTVTSSRPFEQKEKFRCMFCRGGSCNRCGETAYLSLANPAIDKLHSTWIDDSILAMQRPSDMLMKESDLIEQFKRNGIVAVFNLTEPGEHPYCGGGNLKESGFPYHPEKLMASGIKHFNYAWPDMTAPSMNLMKDIVRVACNEITQGGKIAVHCHAGYGRTGIAIASILIALKGMTGLQVIRQIRERRPGSIQTKKQKQFVYDFERSHWEALQVYFDEDVGVVIEKNDSDAEPNTETVSYSSFATLPFSRSTSDVNSAGKKSPRRSLTKVRSKAKVDESEAATDTLKPSSSGDSKNNSIEKDSQTPRSSMNDVCIMQGKSIAQSLRDQQYSLPVKELCNLQSSYGKSSVGAGYQGLSNGTVDLLWNHKCVLICANVLKESCSLSRIVFENIDDSERNLGPESVSGTHANILRSQQSVENLISIAKSMTGLSVDSNGELEVIPHDVKQLAKNILNSANADKDDNSSDDGFPADKKLKNSVTRLKTFKSEINKGIWDRLHSASEILFFVSLDPEGTKSPKDSEKKKIGEDNTVINALDGDLLSNLAFKVENEVLNRKESIAVLCDLFLDFIDSRLDTIFDESVTKKLLVAWDCEIRKHKYDYCDEDDNSLNKDDNESNPLSSFKPTTSAELKKRKNFFSDKMIHVINDILKNEKLERPKLSLLQQLVDVLQSLHSVIESPNKVIDMTNDEGKTEDVGDGPTTTNEDRIEQESYYKLICFRFALSCSLKLRKHKHTSPGSSDGGRCPLALSKAALQNFDMGGTQSCPHHFCAPTTHSQTPSVTGAHDLDKNANPFDFINSSEGEDVPLMLMLMSTLHLLAVGSWTHLDILPNRLRINRKLQR